MARKGQMARTICFRLIDMEQNLKRTYNLNYRTTPHSSINNNVDTDNKVGRGKNRMKNFFQNFGLILFSILIACVIGEVVLRCFFPQKLGTQQFSNHKDLGLLPVPSQNGFYLYPGVYNYTYTNDEHARRITSNDKSGTNFNKTIMLIGDSFTYGIGVNDQETFAYQLQDKLKSSGVKVINGGTPGKGTDYALKYYQVFKEDVKPDMVIYMSHFNDVQDNFREYYYERKSGTELKEKKFDAAFYDRKKSISKSSVYRWLGRNSHLFSLVKSFVVTVMMPAHVIAYEEDFENKDANNFTTIILDHLKNELSNDGVEFHTFYIPHENDMKVLKAENKLRGPESFFKNYCESNQVGYKSFTDEMVQKSKTIDELYLEEGHWTPKGHAMAADILYEYLQNHTTEETQSKEETK